MNSEKFKDSSCPNYEQFCESITSDYMRGMVKAVVAKKDTISDLLLAHFDSGSALIKSIAQSASAHKPPMIGSFIASKPDIVAYTNLIAESGMLVGQPELIEKMLLSSTKEIMIERLQKAETKPRHRDIKDNIHEAIITLSAIEVPPPSMNADAGKAITGKTTRDRAS